jgi:hypothetical protein
MITVWFPVIMQFVNAVDGASARLSAAAGSFSA